MGGIVGLTVREEEGKETRTVVFTGDASRFINNINLLNKVSGYV